MVGSGYFGRIWIQMFWSETDSSILIGYESGYFGCIRIRLCSRITIRLFWLDPDPVLLVGSVSGQFGRIRIRLFWLDPASGILVGSRFNFEKFRNRILIMKKLGSGFIMNTRIRLWSHQNSPSVDLMKL